MKEIETTLATILFVLIIAYTTKIGNKTNELENRVNTLESSYNETIKE